MQLISSTKSNKLNLKKVAFEFPDSLDDSAEAINAKNHDDADFISQADAPEVLMTPAVMQAILSPEVKKTV
ncbi:hypothetical protein O9993_19550 [Vibrio lentus]|nr:hypothetical protein [Vibrio lentus]